MIAAEDPGGTPSPESPVRLEYILGENGQVIQVPIAASSSHNSENAPTQSYNSPNSDQSVLMPNPPSIINNTSSDNNSVQPNDHSKNIKMKIKLNKYSPRDPGPYLVFIQPTNDNVNRLHPMSVGKLIFNNLPQYRREINNIYAAGLKKVKIELLSHTAANSLITERFLIEKNLEAYIPLSLTTRSGIVRDVPTDFTIEELMSEISTSPSIPILEITRFNKRGDKSTPIPVIKITFQSQIIPDFIKFNGVRARVLHLCAICYRNHITEECLEESQPWCLFCQEAHLCTDRSRCQEFVRQKDIKGIMVRENISYKEASAKYYERPYSKALSFNPNFDNTSLFPPLAPEFPYGENFPHKRKGDSLDRPESQQQIRKHSIIQVPKRYKPNNPAPVSHYPPPPPQVHLNPSPLPFNSYVDRDSPFSKKIDNNTTLAELSETVTDIVFNIVSDSRNYEILSRDDLLKNVSTRISLLGSANASGVGKALC